MKKTWAMTVGFAVLLCALCLGCDHRGAGSGDGYECYEGGYEKNEFMPPLEQAIDLDTRDKYTCEGSDCSVDLPDEPWDFVFIAASDIGPVSLVPHIDNGVEVADLGVVDFHGVTDCDIEGAEFTSPQDIGALDVEQVLLVRTDTGDVFKVAHDSWWDAPPPFGEAIYFRYVLLTP